MATFTAYLEPREGVTPEQKLQQLSQQYGIPTGSIQVEEQNVF